VAIRVWHYSICTEESYLFWVRRFILFHGKRHPRELGEPEVGAFLAYLAVDRNVSASAQNQALNALVFLYKRVLERQLEGLGEVVRARRPERLPVAQQEARPRQEFVEEHGLARLGCGVHGLRGRGESGHGFGACHAGSPGSQVLAPLFLQTESRVEGSIRLLSLALRLLTLVEFVLRRQLDKPQSKDWQE
jgi:hypothetical protein